MPDPSTRPVPADTAGVPLAPRPVGAIAPAWPFANQSVLAPMEGVTNPTFRAYMAEFGGIGLLCTEFIRITHHPPSPRQLAEQVQSPCGVPLSVQVMGNDATQMAEAAGIVADAGALVVDINLGCPMPRVVRKGVGAAMLKDPVLLARVLEQMRAKTKGLLSAKIRAGFDDASGVVATAKLIEASGVDFITVHPRRRCDFYEGVADWRIIAELVRQLSIPVIGNGDVWYAQDALRMQHETGCHAVMIGRPALRNPWIFQQIDQLRHGQTPIAPDGAMVMDHLQRIRQRYEQAFETERRKSKPVRSAIGPMKELLHWVGRTVDDQRAFQRRVLRLGSVDELLAESERTLSTLSSEQLDLDAFGSLRLERCGSAVLAAADAAGAVPVPGSSRSSCTTGSAA
jgi:nifR3 family TIM-barrel protein